MVLLPCNFQHANSYLDVSTAFYNNKFYWSSVNKCSRTPGHQISHPVVTEINLVAPAVKKIVIWSNEIIKSKIMI